MSPQESGVQMPEVSWTALFVALGRARESERSDRFFADTLAEHFVHNALPNAPFQWNNGDGDDEEVLTTMLEEFMGDYVAIRTRFFDEFFADATAAGCQQVVVLAAGLDTRAFRIDWPTGTRLYEVDLPDVLSFKEDVLQRQGAVPRCARSQVHIDLRQDWPAELRRNGFDHTVRTAWLAEGLLAYLDPDACDRMLSRITEMSAPGSYFATEHMDPSKITNQLLNEVTEQAPLDFMALLQGGPNEEPASWLHRYGWTARQYDPRLLAAEYGRPAPPAFDPEQGGVSPDGQGLVRATLS